MRLKSSILILIGAGLMACSSVNTISVTASNTPISSSIKNNCIDSIVLPYKTELDSEMLKVIANATKNFTKSRPNGSLNNWVADAVYNLFRDSIKGKPSFCLLNYGGLRNSLNIGNITLGDLFKLMPFDNEIMLVELPIRSMNSIEIYLKQSGGEPISGAKLIKGKLTIDQFDEYDSPTSVVIITSDYLMNGGDNMIFYKDRIGEIYTGELMRDVLIKQAIQQETLDYNNEERIIFN